MYLCWTLFPTSHSQSDRVMLFIVFFTSFAILIYMSLISLLSFCCMLFGDIPGEQKDLYALYTHSADEALRHNYFWHSLTD